MPHLLGLSEPSDVSAVAAPPGRRRTGRCVRRAVPPPPQEQVSPMGTVPTINWRRLPFVGPETVRPSCNMNMPGGHPRPPRMKVKNVEVFPRRRHSDTAATAAADHEVSSFFRDLRCPVIAINNRETSSVRPRPRLCGCRSTAPVGSVLRHYHGVCNVHNRACGDIHKPKLTAHAARHSLRIAGQLLPDVFFESGPAPPPHLLDLCVREPCQG